MRWVVFFVACLAIASAKYAKKTRFGQMLQNVADLENEIEHEFDSWSEEDSDEDTEDDDTWHQPQRHHQPRGKQQKPCPHCTDSKRPVKWSPKDEDEYDSQEIDDYTLVKPRKHTQHREWEEDEPKEPCQPKFDLLRKLSEVNVQLAAKLHREAKQEDNDKNIVLSPVTVQLALASLAQGARGNTKRQLNQILDFGLPKSQHQNAYAALVRSLKGQGSDQSDSKSAQIKCTTNLIFGQQSAQERFIETVRKCFDGEVKKCNFRQKSQECRDQINQWVSSKAGLKSQNILSQTAVTGSTKMLSIGTMQLKANWGKKVRKNLKTSQGNFYPLGEQRAVSVKTLQTEGDFNYFEDEHLRVLGLPTQEKQLTMYVILPKDRHGLNHLEKQQIQYGKQLQQILDRCDSRKQSLKVQLPVVQVIYRMDAKQVLRKLGVEDAFDGDEADFSGINEETEEEEVLKYGRRQSGGLEDIDVKKASQQFKHEHQLYLNKLIQLATIQIDENGIDSATGTQSSTSKQSKPDGDEEREDYEKSSKQFQADHAFAFIVKHNPSNQLLLIGRVVDAGQKAEGGNDSERE